MQQTLQVLGGVGGFFVKLLSKVDETLEQQGIANKIEPVSKEDEADATRAEVGCASCWGRFANRYISFFGNRPSLAEQNCGRLSKRFSP